MYNVKRDTKLLALFYNLSHSFYINTHTYTKRSTYLGQVQKFGGVLAERYKSKEERKNSSEAKKERWAVSFSHLSNHIWRAFLLSNRHGLLFCEHTHAYSIQSDKKQNKTEIHLKTFVFHSLKEQVLFTYCKCNLSTVCHFLTVCICVRWFVYFNWYWRFQFN